MSIETMNEIIENLDHDVKCTNKMLINVFDEELVDKTIKNKFSNHANLCSEAHERATKAFHAFVSAKEECRSHSGIFREMFKSLFEL